MHQDQAQTLAWFTLVNNRKRTIYRKGGNNKDKEQKEHNNFCILQHLPEDNPQAPTEEEKQSKHDAAKRKTTNDKGKTNTKRQKRVEDDNSMKDVESPTPMEEEDIMDLELLEVKFQQIVEDQESKDLKSLPEDEVQLVAREYMKHQDLLLN